MNSPVRLVLKNGDAADLSAFTTRVRGILEMLPGLYPGDVHYLSDDNMAQFGFGDVAFHTTYYGPHASGPANSLTRHLEVSVEPGPQQMAELRIRLCAHQTLLETEIKEWIHFDRSNALLPGGPVSAIIDVLERFLHWTSRPVIVIDEDNPTPEQRQLSDETQQAVKLACALIQVERSDEYFGAQPNFIIHADAPYRLPSLVIDEGLDINPPVFTDAGQQIWAPFVPLQPRLVLYGQPCPTYLFCGNDEPVGGFQEIFSSIDLMKMLKPMGQPIGPAVLPLPI